LNYQIKTKQMNNPFQRPQAGAYKPYLVSALTIIGRTTEANEFAIGNMKLAIVSSITGGVKLFPELNEVCANALNALSDVDETIRYYFWGLSNGQFVVASSNGAYVYDPTDTKAVEFVKEQVELSDNEVIQPYFN
jgi:hypothetical protein